MTIADAQKLRVGDLRERLQQRGLKTKGLKKAALVKLLVSSLTAGAVDSKHCFACGRHVGGRHRYRRHFCGSCEGVFCARCMKHRAHRFGSCGIQSRCLCATCWEHRTNL